RISQITIKNGTEQELYFTFDGHGSTRVLTDFAGAIVELYAFDAYGNAIGFDPSVALTEFLYSGEQFDSKIGQQYLRQRYYDPVTGRFNRLDPFFGNLNDPQSLHKYLYCHADPIQGIDPSGQFFGSGFVSMIASIGLRGMVTTVGIGVVSGAITRAMGASFTSGFVGGTSLTLLWYVDKKRFWTTLWQSIGTGAANASAQLLTNIYNREQSWPQDWNTVWDIIDPAKIISAFGEGFGWGAASSTFGPIIISNEKWEILSRAGVAAATSFAQDTAKYLLEGSYKTWEEYWPNAIFNAIKAFLITGLLNAALPIDAAKTLDADVAAQFVGKILLGGPLGIYTNIIRDSLISE
ncbi:MAG: hypothetical protein LBE12_02760, partial [Planctomycetaceae bacterium]|nr:hypothetical protein [Planctomycetaceae bacterium]